MTAGLVRATSEARKDLATYREQFAHRVANRSDTITGLEEVRLGFGYTWDTDARQIGAAVVSLRDSLDKAAIWAVTPEDDQSGSVGEMSWVPVDPSLPDLELYDANHDDQEQPGS